MLPSHGFTRKLLFKYELEVNCRIGPCGSSSYYSCLANGCGELAEAYIQAAKISSPLSVDFRCMTLLGLRNVINHVGNKVNGPHRRWCAECWRHDLKHNRPLYSRLVWSIDVYEACIHHKRILSMVCPHCSEFQYSYPTLPRAHVCDYCGLNLFEEDQDYMQPPSDKSMWVSRAIHRLIERSCAVGLEISERALPDAIKNLAERFAGNKAVFLANGLNFRATTLRDWEAGLLKPSLPRLIDFCYRLDIPPDQLLLDKCILTDPSYWRRLRADYIYTPSMLPPHLYNDVLKFLDSAVAENPWPPFQPSKIAYHFGVFPFLLKNRFKEQCQLLDKRWTAYKSGMLPAGHH